MAEREKQKIEQSISQAFSKITPDAFDALLSDLGTNQKGVLPEMTDSVNTVNKAQKTPLARMIPKIAAAAAAVLLLIGGFATGSYITNHKVISTATLDVNPSVEIELNRKDTVLDVKALNEDGKTIIGNMDFKDQSLEMTVNALIGSMFRGGYLSDIANSILISVDSGDAARAEALQKQISDAVLAEFGGEKFSGAVLSQTIAKGDELQALADQYGISLGKAQLIRQITTQNSFYTFAELAPLTVNELNLLSESGGLTLESVNASGTASDKAYIGEDKAKELAFAAVSVKQADVTSYRCEMEHEKDVMTYEIQFDCAGKEYEINVNALTGEIVKLDEEASEHYRPQSDGGNTTDTTPTDGIDQTEAKKIAFDHAGVSESNVTNYQCKTDVQNGVAVYEIEFTAGGFEYDYDIGAGNGKILHVDKEWADTAPTGGSSTSDSSAYIGEAKAKEIALSHAGVSAADARNMECKLDRENGVVVYEIRFEAGNCEYEYDIAAENGTVIKFDREDDDDAKGETNAGGNTAGNTYIGQAKAKEIALAHAGVDAASATEMECELEKEHGVALYEISFKAGGYEYEYDVNALTGDIQKYDRERD